MKVKYVCRYCGSDDVLHDAWAVWNVETQEFEVSSVQDNAFCGNCDGETSLNEVPVTEEGAPNA